LSKDPRAQRRRYYQAIEYAIARRLARVKPAATYTEEPAVLADQAEKLAAAIAAG
jgi:hypothetical protein